MHEARLAAIKRMAEAVHAGARLPFRFLLCGDPGLSAAFRSLLLSGCSSSLTPSSSKPC